MGDCFGKSEGNNPVEGPSNCSGYKVINRQDEWFGVPSSTEDDVKV